MINQKGQVLVIVIAALGIVLFTVLFIIAGAQLYFQNSAYNVNAEKATALAEAGIDKAINALNATGGNYTGETETSLGDGSFSVTITPVDTTTSIIESTGYVPNKSNPKAKRTIKITTSKGVGIAFNYGIQVGEGGLELGNSNLVKGSVYSNGSITAGNTNEITGDVWVAGGPQPNPDQAAPDCVDNNCQDFIFGRSVNGESHLDVAQSFKPQESGVLNKVSIRIKKFGSPPNITVRILQDDDGEPDKNAVLTTGTLYASLVTASYGWIDITFNSSPALTQDESYWLMFDTSSDNNNYWSWQNDLAQSYTRGVPKWSPNWSIGNAQWNSFNGDLAFKDYLGGAPTSVRANSSKMEVGGEVHANTIQNLEIEGNAYYQTIITSTVNGTSNPGSADPPPKVFPISEANIAEWKDQADGEDNDNTTGPISNCVSTLGPIKVIGDVNFDSGCRVTIKSPIWITGNLTMNSNNVLTLDSSWGAGSGVMVVDGTIEMNSNNHLNGTGVGTSLLMGLSNYNSPQNGGLAAIKVNSNGNTGVYYASSGIIEPGTANSFKELTAWGIRLVSNSVIDYETGLSSTLFTSGPTGAYTLLKGTYQVK
ncbi:hypothetical protein HYS94_02580 [Candidatus Daviesbacteria bacterium]|nr:hypothetical protein [Candidatus Daviesbacteria bacterium]